jgi:hypothetical protein
VNIICCLDNKYITKYKIHLLKIFLIKRKYKKYKMQLEDLIATYPSYYEVGIQEITTNKREFIELASSSNEKIPLPGKFYKHQDLIARLMLMTSRLFLFHETGTGKTCAFIRVCEYFRKLHLQGDPKGIYTKVVILVKGKSLAREIKRQILCFCTNREYVTDMIENPIGIYTAEAERNRDRNITNELKKWYIIRPYGQFVNQIAGEEGDEDDPLKKAKYYSDEEIIKEFSNTIFVVDEVHNVHNIYEGENSEKVRKVSAQLWRIFHLAVNTKIILSSATPMINNPNELKSILNLILPTDNQMGDDINLEDVNLKPQDLEKYFRGIISYVRALDTGLDIKYIGDPIDYSFNIGTDLIPIETKVCKSTMKEEEDLIVNEETGENFIVKIGQLATYKKVYDPKKLSDLKALNLDNIGEEELPEEELYKKQPFYLSPRHASDIVYPDGSFGHTGFKRYIIKKDKDFAVNPTPVDKFGDPIPPLSEYINDREKMSLLATKFVTIIDLCKKAKGKCFVFTDFVESGAIPLSLCFEGLGFKPFLEENSIFKSIGSKDRGKLPPVCSEVGESQKREVRSDFPKMDRYGLFIGTTSDTRFRSLMDAFNSPENINGDYVKVFIGSKIARDGINLTEISEIHIVNGSWNLSSRYQAESRGIRATSHRISLERERSRLSLQGSDPSLARVTVKIYNHAAVAPDENVESDIDELSDIDTIKRVGSFSPRVEDEEVGETREQIEEEQEEEEKILEGELFNIENEEEELFNIENEEEELFNIENDEEENIPSIDIQLYVQSEEKSYKIKKIERIMKQCALDCQIHYSRNTRLYINQYGEIQSPDKDYSSECDYNKCLYRCYDDPPKSVNEKTYELERPDLLDVSTFDVFYPDEIVEMVKEDLRIIFSVYFSLPLEQIYATLQEYRRKFIDYAITDLVSSRIFLRNRFGISCYLTINGDVLSLTQGQSTDFMLSYYTETLIGLEINEFNDYISNLQSIDQDNLLRKIYQISKKEDFSPSEDVEFNKVLDEFNLESKVLFLEKSILDELSGNGTVLSNYIVYDKFSNWIFQAIEPVDAIQKITESLAKRGSGRGRKPLSTTPLRFTSEENSLISSSRVSPVSSKYRLDSPIEDEDDDEDADEDDDEDDDEYDDLESSGSSSSIGSISSIKSIRQLTKKAPSSVSRKTSPLSGKLSPLNRRIVSPKTNNPVYFHTLYGQEKKESAFGLTAKLEKAEVKIRLLNPSENDGWRNVTVPEATVYRAIIQKKLEEQKSEYSDYPIYGTLMNEDDFRIVNQNKNPVKSGKKSASQDKRGKASGKMCDTWSKPDLIETIWSLNQWADQNEFPQLLNPADEKISHNNYDEFLNSWRAFSKVQICQSIRNYMIENNLILTR